MLTTFLHSPIVHGAVVGFVTAAGSDYHNFLTWKKWQDALTFDWSTATFRWFAGTVAGGLMGGGFGAWLS